MTPLEHRIRSRELRLRERELALRHSQAREASAEKIADAGFRSLLLVNAVGVIVLAALLAAALAVPEAQDFVPFIVMAIGLQSAGLLLAVSLYWVRYMKRRYEERRDAHGTGNPWWWLMVLASIASAVLFLAGVGFIVYGGFTQLGDIDDDSQQSRMTRT